MRAINQYGLSLSFFPYFSSTEQMRFLPDS
jgi:hypothetical protein